MLKLPIKNHQFIGPLCIAALCLLLNFFEPLSSDYLAFTRNELPYPNWWQFISSNFVHTNTNHLLLNLAGLLLLWAVHGEYYKTTKYLIHVVILSLWVTIGLYMFSTSLNWYAGLSGVLHGLFVYGAYIDIQNRVRFSWLLFIGVWIKIAHEQYFGAEKLLSDLIAAHVAIDAHLYGALGGLSLILIGIRLKQR